MAEIAVLPKEIAELIAAGEVVERPASVIKELVENSIDAGASVITVEIEHGGITYMRVTDNGCGIPKEEVRTAFLRHATSKIKTAGDLDAILTLGFRGEALASIAAVSRVELLSAVKDAKSGVGYVIHGGEEISLEEVGCPQGTTIIIRDLFYNVPARMKFLKKDVSEANTVAAVVDRIALSHPEVSVRLIRDGKTTLTTPGDSKLKSAVYSVLGRDYSASLIPVDYTEGTVRAEGFTVTPARCRPNRNGQFFFLNGRYIKSGTMAAALDQAYKNAAMVGKFPACVLRLTLPPGTVDVNVHPTKTEVRFSDEHKVFDVVYRAVKQAIAMGDQRPELQLSAKKPVSMFGGQEGYRQVKNEWTPAQDSPVAPKPDGGNLPKTNPTAARPKADAGSASSVLQSSGFLGETPRKAQPQSGQTLPIYEVRPEQDVKTATSRLIDIAVEEPEENPPVRQESTGGKAESAPVESAFAVEHSSAPAEKQAETLNPGTQEGDRNPEIDSTEIRYVGEAFATYIIVSHKDALYLIDKHAAHERIRFEELRRTLEIQCQLLLSPVSVTLMREEYAAVIANEALLGRCGFMTEDFGDSTVLVRGVPSILSGTDPAELLREVAGSLLEKGTAESERIDDILHRIACKSAIKAGNITSKEEQTALAVRVLSSRSLMYCPHGRPIAFCLKRSQIEKQFGRLGS